MGWKELELFGGGMGWDGMGWDGEDLIMHINVWRFMRWDDR